MTITVQEELTAYELKDRLWGSAEDTLQRIIDEGKENTFFATLADLYSDRIPTILEINDLLRFDEDTVFEWCGIKNIEDDREEELVFNQEDLDTMREDNMAEDIMECLDKAMESNGHLVYIDGYRIEAEIDRELTDEELKILIDLGV